MASKLNFRFRMKNWLVKSFFRTTNRLIQNKKDKMGTVQYRKGMDFFTGFLKAPKNIDFSEEKIDQLPALWITPKNIDNDSVILYLHGGAYGMGSIRSHRKIAARIARACRSKCVIVEYRLAPEHLFPAATDDALEVYEYLLYMGYKPNKIVIGGDSAGGGLTLATLQNIRDKGLPQPLAAFCMSPWLDLTCSSPEVDSYQHKDPFIHKSDVIIWGKRYAGENIKHPLVSPLYADMSNVAPFLIQVGTAEILLFENRKFYEKCIKNGIDIQYEEYKDMVHVFQMFAGFLPLADKAIESISRFILSKSEKAKSNSIYHPTSNDAKPVVMSM